MSNININTSESPRRGSSRVPTEPHPPVDPMKTQEKEKEEEQKQEIPDTHTRTIRQF